MIPKNWEGSDFYRDLGVAAGSSQAEIRSAYRRLVRQFHPDINNSADRGEKFREITYAYSVLSDAKLRREYDEYLFEQGEMPIRDQEPDNRKKRRFFALLGRVALFIIVLFLLKNFGFISSPQTIVNSNQPNAGISVQGDERNQALVLMAGPQGPPGPAGVAGRDGFIGMNGYQGKDGLPGAPGLIGATGAQGPQGIQGIQGIAGPAGPAGAAGAEGPGITTQTIERGNTTYCSGRGGVRIIPSTPGAIATILCNGETGTGGGQLQLTRFSGEEGPCLEGGVKINSVGSVEFQYVCDGKSGATFAQGAGNIATCVANVKYTISSRFLSQNFKIKNVKISDLTNCSGKRLDIYLKILDNPSLQDNSGNYSRTDQIHCWKTLPTPGTTTATFDGTSSCEVQNSETGDVIRSIILTQVFSLDISETANGIALEITD